MITKAMLPDPTVDLARPMLLCPTCGETNSATPGDYWYLPPTHVFRHCRRPMRLVTTRTTYHDWTPKPTA